MKESLDLSELENANPFDENTEAITSEKSEVLETDPPPGGGTGGGVSLAYVDPPPGGGTGGGKITAVENNKA